MNPDHKPNLFDIDSAEAFFYAIRHSASILIEAKAKEIDRLLFVILGLNHLREWIAPGYRHTDSPANSSAEKFYCEIYNLPSFKLLNDICNHSKHLKPLRSTATTEYDLAFDDWPDVDAVQSFDDGPPTGYRVGDIDILFAITEVIDFYNENWFSKNYEGDGALATT